MVKTLSLIAVGILIGTLVALAIRPSANVGGRDEGDSGLAIGNLRTESAVAHAPDELSERVVALEARVGELEGKLDELLSLPIGASNGVSPPEYPDRVVQSRESAAPGRVVTLQSPWVQPQTGQQIIDRLVQAGFTSERADWLRRRLDELSMEALRARYEAERSGDQSASANADFGPDVALRKELGDADYERYLQALGRSTDVAVTRVFEGSPAEQAGLLPGDRIVTYDGTRVFDFREVSPLTFGVPPA